MSPTYTYTSLQEAYDYFNQSLFQQALPSCLITMQRKSKAQGYFSASRFENKGNVTEITHEIALNPATFTHRTATEILSTLVHEMCHLWQQENGKPSRNGYHNRQWSTQMTHVGLIPSHTGVAGGRQTGQSMTHYIEEGGKFALVVEAFLSGNKTLLYQDRVTEQTKKKKQANKVKYTCASCNMNVWGKAGLSINCVDDDEVLKEESN